MRTGIIIQARTDSTRLPKKMVLPFFKGKGILELLIERLAGAKLDVPLILATTKRPNDDILVHIANKYDLLIYRGSEENVLQRFIKASEVHQISKIIRVCADNPYLDITALQYLINDFDSAEVDYWCYALSDGTPSIKTHYGFWAEGVKKDVLMKIESLTNEKVYQEHVTNYVYTHPESFQIKKVQIDKEIEKKPIRLTIDTQSDFNTARQIYKDVVNQNINPDAKSLSDFVNLNMKWIQTMNEEINSNKK